MSSSSPRSPHAVATVVSISGSHANIRLAAPSRFEPSGAISVTIGNFMGLRTPQSQVIGVVTNVDGSELRADVAGSGQLARVDLLGEIRSSDHGSTRFQRGITRYPAVGD